MSIYVTNRRRLLEDASASHAPGRMPAPMPASAAARAAKRDWSHLRKANPANYLLPMSRAWMGQLPAAVQPATLCGQFPRIANLLALAWDDDALCRTLLEDLLVGQREYRKGFPADIHRELEALREHYCNGTPAPQMASPDAGTSIDIAGDAAAQAVAGAMPENTEVRKSRSAAGEP